MAPQRWGRGRDMTHHYAPWSTMFTGDSWSREPATTCKLHILYILVFCCTLTCYNLLILCPQTSLVKDKELVPARFFHGWLVELFHGVCVCVCCFLGTCFEITSQHTVVENRTSSNHGFCTVLLWVSPAWKILKSGPVSKNQAALQRVILAIQRRCWDGTWWNHP